MDQASTAQAQPSDDELEFQVAVAHAVTHTGKRKQNNCAEEWEAGDPYAVTQKADVIVEVDYDRVREDLMTLMEAPAWDDGSYAPILIRLAWHSSGTYCASSGTGGSFGGTMRHPVEAGDPENAGLGTARDLLMPIIRKYKNVSTSDIWILAAYCALEHTGGPRIPFTPGRKDVSASMAVAPGRLPKPELGSSTDMDVDEQGRIQGWQKCAAHIRQVFQRMGLSDRETVALICGGHAYGRRHPQLSGYAGACVQNPTRFSNGHAAALSKHEWMLISNSTKMPDGQPLPEDVRPAVGKRQYIDGTTYKIAGVNTAGVEPVDAKGFRAGKYRCVSEWVNCRQSVDVSSSVMGFIRKGQEINVLEVKLFDQAIRGCAERGCWISIIASTGETLFELIDDVDTAELTGRYRTLDVVPYFDSTHAWGIGRGKIWAHEFEISRARFGMYEGKHGALFGYIENDGGSWALIHAPQRGLLAELIMQGFNDQRRCPLVGQSGNQTMLISDMVMLWDPGFRNFLKEYAADEDLLRRDFGAAFKRLTELGCPWSKDFKRCPFACS